MIVISPSGLDSVEAGAPEDEIEITPKMIEVGALLVLSFHHEYGSSAEDIAVKIYRAMASALKIVEGPVQKSNSLGADSG
jgi:hypothetical protein